MSFMQLFYCFSWHFCPVISLPFHNHRHQNVPYPLSIYGNQSHSWIFWPILRGQTLLHGFISSRFANAKKILPGNLQTGNGKNIRNRFCSALNLIVKPKRPEETTQPRERHEHIEYASPSSR